MTASQGNFLTFECKLHDAPTPPKRGCLFAALAASLPTLGPFSRTLWLVLGDSYAYFLTLNSFIKTMGHPYLF